MARAGVGAQLRSELAKLSRPCEKNKTTPTNGGRRHDAVVAGEQRTTPTVVDRSAAAACGRPWSRLSLRLSGAAGGGAAREASSVLRDARGALPSTRISPNASSTPPTLDRSLTPEVPRRPPLGGATAEATRKADQLRLRAVDRGRDSGFGRSSCSSRGRRAPPSVGRLGNPPARAPTFDRPSRALRRSLAAHH